MEDWILPIARDSTGRGELCDVPKRTELAGSNPGATATFPQVVGVVILRGRDLRGGLDLNQH
jgi:hypothetical protein